MTKTFQASYDASPDRREHMAEVCSTMSDGALAQALVQTIQEMLADSPIDTVFQSAAVIVGDIRAGERRRLGFSEKAAAAVDDLVAQARGEAPRRLP